MNFETLTLVIARRFEVEDSVPAMKFGETHAEYQEGIASYLGVVTVT
jgi:hypothetical protein